MYRRYTEQMIEKTIFEQKFIHFQPIRTNYEQIVIF